MSFFYVYAAKSHSYTGHRFCAPLPFLLYLPFFFISLFPLFVPSHFMPEYGMIERNTTGNFKREGAVYMPGFTTHYILGMKAFNDLPNNQLKYIIAKYRWLYQLGLQGPDMFFYNIPILRHRDYRNVGSYMHEHHIQDFFRCYLENLQDIESRQQREEGLSYFCGFVCHYIGDSI